MRSARIKAEGAGYYHVISKAIEGRFIFGDPEKEKFRGIMRKLEDFCGLHIVTYSIMSSHWHILLEVPLRHEISDEELVRRIAILYDSFTAATVCAQLKEMRKTGDNQAAERLRTRYTYRMYDLSEFCKTLKQRFSQYYNTKYDRCGTLWNQRFKSVLVEGSRNALLTVAAYVDLNAVRAGLVADPKDYRWSGYGEAIAGGKNARHGLTQVMNSLGLANTAGWSNVASQYRQYLYAKGRQKCSVGPDGKPVRAGFSTEQVKQVLDAGGRLPRHELLRCRVRYFSDGLVLGSTQFVEEQFARYRDEFGLKRETGARAMRYGQWDGLSTMRDLRKAVILIPVTG